MNKLVWVGLLIFCYIRGQNVYAQVTGGKARKSKNEIVLFPVYPKPDSIIPRGEVFFVINIKKGVKLSIPTVKFFLDNRHVSQNVKIQGNKITVLYLTPLGPGKHEIFIEAKEEGYEWLPAFSYTFYVDQKFSPTEDSARRAQKRAISIQGNVTADSRQTFLSGPGTELRQEPRITNTYNVNLNINVGKVTIPIRSFRTSDEATYPYLGSLPRNTFTTGVQHKNLEVLAGDISPVFDKLALTGLRIRGARLNILLKRFQLHMLQGFSQRGIEGSLLRFQGSGLPPSNLRDDSTYILAGTYRREIMALRMVLGNTKEGSAVGINLLKAKDLESSIQYGSKPRENLVISVDQQFVTNANRLKAQAGIAHSLTTLDFSQGALTRRQMDSSINGNYGFDPQKWDKIQTINFTTSKPGYPSLAGYLTLIYQPKNQTITFDFRYFGNAFQSLGNPFARADIRSFSLQDQVSLWKRKIQVMAKYQFQDNNLSKTEFATIQQHFTMVNLLIAPGVKYPQISINHVFQYRKTPVAPYHVFMVNDAISNATATFMYLFKIGKLGTFVNGTYNINQRKDLLRPMNDNKLTTLSAGFRQTMDKYGLGWDFQFVTTDIQDVQNGLIRLNQSFDGRIRWTIKKIKTTFSGGYMMTRLFKNKFTPFDSYRHSITGLLSIKIWKGFQLDIEGGKSPNRNALMPLLNYDEWYFYGRASWNISHFLRK